ncbi:hypothetical protein NVI2019_PEGOAJLN_01170 [Providencia alcalifaciens]|uniref:hypothetical protein n=1 Tax=Providencia alcalifaciens TaxID=126385 RepID=UPI0003E24A1F|nr:hypothetical protein [Providencia alcalifaciens]ETT02079.1 hypothetical protein HMPREF1568_2869 [Providencia alcalifaciens PAL-3]EUC99615.1 hypothetical protein HMPREF1566_2404 [Providencia alcalifaciens PAL-1]EUD04308.1 hypothetical protein HMPREF1565_0830 [Providencia alcalifaciens RIMD 1656011]CAG9414952.1 hypothetical protein NVI2019_PEGOAJLN_01170 [Providencia alcalifaciens]CAG9418298.1 hypothetical protein NVI2019_NGLDDFDA_01607 [Providencia alcalifaciens]
MDKSRQQFEEWRSKNKSSTINLFDVWQASRESLINSLEPVGYIDNAESIDLEHGRVCYLYKDCIDKINIPLYRLDK